MKAKELFGKFKNFNVEAASLNDNDEILGSHVVAYYLKFSNDVQLATFTLEFDPSKRENEEMLNCLLEDISSGSYNITVLKEFYPQILEEVDSLLVLFGAPSSVFKRALPKYDEFLIFDDEFKESIDKYLNPLSLCVLLENNLLHIKEDLKGINPFKEFIFSDPSFIEEIKASGNYEKLEKKMQEANSKLEDLDKQIENVRSFKRNIIRVLSML